MINTAVRRINLGRAGAATGALATVAVVVGFAAPLTAHAEAQDACSGVEAPCRIVAHADVTGDGRTDTVGIVWQQFDHGMVTRYQVRVRTAEGTLLRKTDKTASWEGTLFRGSTNIDGRPGKDIVVGHALGAHTAFYRVYSYHDGRLVLLKAPKLPKKVGARTLGRSWVVDSAISSFEGIRRTTPNGQVVITDTFGVRDPSASVYTGWKFRYRWDENHWAPISSEHRAFTDEQAAKLAGWHVKGLHDRF